MRGRWRVVARTAAATAVLTTAFWFAVAAWWYQRGASPAPIAPPAKSLPARAATAADETRLLVPVAGIGADRLSDTFRDSRAEGSRRHDAIDIIAPRGTPVLAAATGRVEKLFVSEEGGNTVYVRSPDGRRLYYYAHLEGYAPGLAEGQRVRQGARIGSVGASGNADPAAPHLHFAVWSTSPERKWWEEGTALNPYPMLTVRGPQP